jgi:PKD repeat protein
VYDFSKLQARYTATSTGGCIPLALKFKSASVYDQQIKWDFDDGTILQGNSQDSISHVFQNPGIYKVKLVAYNPEGCPSKDSTVQFITVQKPVSFLGDTLQFCRKGDTLSLPLLPQGELTYSWEPVAFLDNPASASVKIIQPDSSLWYTASVRTSEGCTSQAKFLLRDGTLLAQGRSDTVRGCAPLAITFASLSRNSKTERWIFGDGDSSALLNPNAQVSHTYNQPGIYQAILKAQNDTACIPIAYDTLQIEVLAGPQLPDTLIRFCSPGSLALQAPSGNVLSWSWSPGFLLNDSSIANPVLQVSAPAVFQLAAKDSNSCVSRSKVEVRDGRLKANFSLPNVPLCAPAVLQPVNQSINPVESRFFWGADSLFVSGLAPAQLFFPKGGRYTIRLRVLSDTACISFADTSMEIVLGGPGNTGPDSISFCPKDSVILQAPSGPGFQYVWPPEVIIGADSSRSLLYPANSVPVIVTIRDSLQCIGESRFFLRQEVLDTSFNVVSEFDPCTDLLQYRFSTAGLPDHYYSWSVREDTFAINSSSFTYVFQERNSYRIRLLTQKIPCIISRVKIVEVNDPPLNLRADFNLSLVYEECAKGPVLKIENNSEGATSQRWSWNGISSDQLLPSPDISGLDSIRLRLEVFQGPCQKEISKSVRLNQLLPPNLVTLSSDGKNDEFAILNLPEKSSIEIWDRWGKKVYQEPDYRNNWRPEAEGIYFYRLGFENGNSCASWLRVVK